MLSDTLRAQRLGALEATALLRRVMEEIDVAVFAFDGEQRLRLVNRGGERLLGQPSERLLGLGADALGLAACLDGDDAAHHRGRVSRRRRAMGGARHYLSPGRAAPPAAGAVRPEPRAPGRGALGVAADSCGCWATRSTTRSRPIKSIAGSLRSLAERSTRAAGLGAGPPLGTAGDRGAVRVARPLHGGLRAAGPAAAAAAPAPVARGRVGAPGGRARDAARRCGWSAGPPLAVLTADGDQLDQLLINLVRNAADAALETGGGVRVGWRSHRRGRRGDRGRRRPRTAGPGQPVRPVLHHQGQRAPASASC